MKTFLKIIGGSTIGFLIGMFLIFLILLGIAGNAGKSKKVKVEANSVLKLNLAIEIPDRAVDNPFGNFSPGWFDTGPTMGLFELKELIEHAKEDDKIKGIYLNTDLMAESFANLDELRRVLVDFKSSGKFIISYNNFSSQKSYLLSSAADEILVHPSGMFEFDGIAIETRYFKGLLDKLEIKPYPLYAGDYKSASEPYRLTEMSEANRRQLHALLEDLHSNYLTTISEARGVSQEELFRLMDGLLIENAQDGLDSKLIDGLAFEDQAFDIVREKMGYDEKDKINFIDVDDYADSYTPPVKKGVRERIAVVYAEGTIVLGEGDESSIGGEKFMKLIRKLRKDDKIKAIVLRVNSGGGVAFSSDKIWRELELAKAAKPLVVSMGNYAASGGYLISAGADKIYAEKNTITGSIGVVGILLNLEEFFENKLGVTFDKESIGQYADYGSLTHEWSDREHEVAQGMVKKIYGEFKQKVSDGRGISMDSVEVIARGRVWTGQDALEIGLVDEIGGLDEALAFAAEKANLENYKLKEYPQEKDFFQQLMEGLMESRTDKMLKKELGIFYSEFEMLRDLEEWSGYQMRIPFDLSIN